MTKVPGGDWLSLDKHTPPETDRYYLVFVPEWEGYGNTAHMDICWWDGHFWSQGQFGSVEDGAWVSHFALVLPPRKEETDG